MALSHFPKLLDAAPERPIEIDLQALEPSTVFPAATGRIVSNVLLLAWDSLPSGGAITLAGAADDLFVRITGPAAAWPAGIAVCLTNEAEARAALTEWRQPQMALTALLAHASRKRLSLLITPTASNDPPILRLSS